MEIKNYSQSSEQSVILHYFGKYVGTFLDFGSNDGRTLSNTFALSKLGWSGVCVEPSPKAFKRLKLAHPFTHNVAYFNFAVGPVNGQTVLYESGEHLGNGDTSLLSTINKTELERWTKEEFTPVTVPVVTFDNFLKQSPFRKFQFISIDIEGSELDVLPQMDLNDLDCRLICVEFNGKDQDKYDEIIIPQGFNLIHKNAENLLYGKEN